MGNLIAPFKKFLANKNTITILGVLIGIVVLYFGYTWRVNQSIAPTSIPYALETMPSGTVITEDFIGYTEVPKDMLKNMENVITDVNSIRNMLVSYDSKIPQNGFFFSENLIAESEMPDSVFSNIPDGYTIYSLEVDNHSTYANSIFPDDSIDLYMKAQQESTGTMMYGPFITSIKVLAVKDGDGRDVFANKDELGEPAELLFAVPEDQFLLLKKAYHLGGFLIEPIPRNDSYSEHPEPTTLVGTDFRDEIRAKTAVLGTDPV